MQQMESLLWGGGGAHQHTYSPPALPPAHLHNTPNQLNRHPILQASALIASKLINSLNEGFR